MNKTCPVFLLAISAVIASQNVYAHNANPDTENRIAEREQAKKQDERQTWDDFMSAVKAQEKEKNTDDDSAHHNSSEK